MKKVVTFILLVFLVVGLILYQSKKNSDKFIESAQESSYLRSIEGYAKGVEAQYYEGKMSDFNYSIDDAVRDYKFDDVKVSNCSVTYENNIINLTGCKVEGVKGTFSYNKTTGAQKVD